MAAYPTTITFLDAASFVASTEDPSIPPSDMAGGYSISRPRFTRTPRRSWSFKYVDMSDASKATFEAFWQSVYGGANAFTWTVPPTGEIVNVRFDKTKCSFRRIGFGPINIWESETITLMEV